MGFGSVSYCHTMFACADGQQRQNIAADVSNIRNHAPVISYAFLIEFEKKSVW